MTDIKSPQTESSHDGWIHQQVMSSPVLHNPELPPLGVHTVPDGQDGVVDVFFVAVAVVVNTWSHDR